MSMDDDFRSSQATTIVVGVVVLSSIGLIVLLVLALFAPADRDILLIGGMFLGFIATIVTALMAFAKADEARGGVREVRGEVKELHTSVNSKMDALIESVRREATAEATLIERAAAAAALATATAANLALSEATQAATLETTRLAAKIAAEAVVSALHAQPPMETGKE